MQVTAGLYKGDTVLPLPAKSAAISDKDHVHLLEGAFVTWTRQIKEVLKVDPSAALLVSSQLWLQMRLVHRAAQYHQASSCVPDQFYSIRACSALSQ